MFITNERVATLKERLKTLIKHSEEMKFLVGFFYFSGIKELYEELKRLDSEGKLKVGHIKILIGLDIDQGVWGVYEGAKIGKYFNPYECKNAFFESLKKALTSHELDNKEIYEQVEFFIKLLREEKIILKKTLIPNHSKLYIFKLHREAKELIPGGVFITGSSNLTKAGLVSQNEFNVEIKDYGIEEADKYFDEQWEKAIPLEDSEEIIKIIKNETLFKDVSPYEAYAYLLKTYIELHRGEVKEGLIEFLKKKGYRPYAYQIEAVAQSLQNCEYHNGTLLADVVGLGKTVMACLVAKSLGKRGIVICPPHLIGDDYKTYGWKKYLEDFELFGWEVFSIGKLEEVLEYVKDKDFKIIIVDEAHRFRNELTERYHYLKEICRGKKVILLTATPFNNRPSDIFSLLKLFNIPKKSTIVYDEKLFAIFERYQIYFEKLSYIMRYANSQDRKRRERALEYYKKIFGEDGNYIDSERLKIVKRSIEGIANEMRRVIEPVTIRRNRLDLKYYGEKIDFPEVKDPIEVFFELTHNQSEFYDEIINTFLPYDEGGKFTGAIYFPARYEKGANEEKIEDKKESEEYFMRVFQRNLYDFMRRLLVKRFESSFGAFKDSIQRFISVHETALEFVKKTKKFILDRKLMEEIISEEDPDRVFELLEEYERSLKEEKIYSKYYKVYDVNELKGFEEDLKKDKELFIEILKKFNELELDKNDPKIQKLIQEIRDWLKTKRKIVIYTEYLDTAKYLEKILDKEFKEILLSAYGNLTEQKSRAIFKNFDAQIKEKEWEDKYQILLTTDKLSEGFNLNRAGMVINYDIPWNPVRVIQRVGRINRIGKKVYDEIYILNFFPTEKGADIVKSREIAQQKMFMIHNVLGEDAKIFSPDETPRASELYRRLNSFPEEEESFFTKIRKEYERIKEETPDIEEKIKNMPNRVKVAKYSEENGLCVFIKRGKDLFVGYKNYELNKTPLYLTFEDVYEKIKADKNTPKIQLSDNFWESYHQILNKSEYSTRIKTIAQSRENKAFNLLNSILRMEDEKLKGHKKFISDLIEDIREFGTLSEYTLSLIIEWEKYLKDIDKLSQEIKKLKEEMGEDFLEKIKKYAKENMEEIIIAIENQKKVIK